ncbi:MAG TPA: DUF3710 domain-containing protein [Frankiaceae bacterium]|nr:DUF3710 domain-containing protein [Frankiaceae bacterium]
MFRRKGKDAQADDGSTVADEAPTELTDELADEASEESGEGGESATRVAIDLEGGPYDEDDAPADEIPRIDLGSLRVPMVDGLEVRLDVDQQTGEPAQLVLADGESMLQLAAFAAPRNSGIWDLVRAEIAESLVAAGGAAEETDGALGTELAANIPTGEPGGALAPARFIGIDRPRWFLRGLLSGPAAVDPQAAARLEFAFRGTVVVRGKDAMPSRDPLPLKLPPEALAVAQEAQEAQAAGGGPTLEQLEQGPTITETR